MNCDYDWKIFFHTSVFFFFSISSQSVFTLKDAATAELQQRADVPPVYVAVSHQTQEKTKNHTEVVEELLLSNTTDTTEEIRSEDEIKRDIDKKPNENLTSTEEIPSFSEWTQKQLEEAEKKKVAGNVSAQTPNVNVKSNSGMLEFYFSFHDLCCQICIYIYFIDLIRV